MTDFKIKANLLKVKGAFVTNIKGATATKRCVCIPLDGSGLILGEKGCYLNLHAFSIREPRYEETHCLKVDFDRVTRESMTKEELDSQPIVGGLRPFVPKPREMAVNTESEADQAPF